MKNEQERFWIGDFGDTYTDRNSYEQGYNNRIPLFTKILTDNGIQVTSALEFGANIGLNLDAIRHIFPQCRTMGIEINKTAFDILKTRHEAMHSSASDAETQELFELTITSVFLIHQNPCELQCCYHKLYELSERFILINEYFSPIPVEVEYRGHAGKLFKRDFAKELWALYPSLTLVDHGFFWSKDPHCPFDDSNWFLFKK